LNPRMHVSLSLVTSSYENIVFASVLL